MKLNSQTIFLEGVVLFCCSVRFFDFWTNSLDEALQQTGKSLQRAIIDKERACDDLTNFLSADSSELMIDSNIAFDKGASMEQVQLCRKEALELRTFAWSVGRMNVLSYTNSPNPQVRFYAMEIVRISTSPKLLHRCEYSACVDWSGIFDFSVFSSLFVAQLPGATSFQAETILFLSGVVTMLYSLIVIRLRCFIRSLTYSWINSVGFAFSIAPHYILSPSLWVVRSGGFICLYICSFVVLPRESELTLSLRLFLFGFQKSPQELGLWFLSIFTVIGVMTIFFTSAPAEIENGLRLEKLAEINQVIAQAWIDGDPNELCRLRATTLIELCKAADLSTLNKARRKKIREALMGDRLIKALHENRHSVFCGNCKASPLMEAAVSVDNAMKQLAGRSWGIQLIIFITLFTPLLFLALHYSKVCVLYFTAL